MSRFARLSACVLLVLALGGTNAAFARPLSDDDIPGAVPLTDSPIVGYLNAIPGEDNDDVFSVDLAAGQTLSASIESTAAFLGRDNDFDLYLYAPGTLTLPKPPQVDKPRAQGSVASAMGQTYPDSFVYPAATAGTYYLDAWADIYAEEVQGEYTLTWDIKPSAQLSLEAPAVSQYATSTIDGFLKDAGSTPLASKPVDIWARTTGAWKYVDTVLTDSEGYYSRKMTPKTKTTYRTLFAGDAIVGGQYSPERTVLPEVYLTRPTFGRYTLKYGTTYKATGDLRPRHKEGTWPVRISAERYENGKYRWKKTYDAKAYDYASYSKYVRSIKLPSKGKWRLRAVHPADSLNAKTYSGWRYVKVE